VRVRFFGGKGGAGKTTLAAAAALARAESGRRVLVVSTDPAHSLGDALGISLTGRPRPIPTRRGRLHAVELDAERALARWLAARRPALRAIALQGTVLERREVDRLLRLALPGVEELVGLVEVMRLASAGRYDEVVVDTAPTGHTLRLLAGPALLGRLAAVLDRMYAKHRFISQHLRGDYQPDASDALIAELDADARSLAKRLRDPAESELVWVTLPETLSLRETDDAVDRLAALGIDVERIVINQVTGDGRPACRACRARRRAEHVALADLPANLGRRPIGILPGQPREPHGLPRLRAIARAMAAGDRRGGLRAIGARRPRARSVTAPRRRGARAEPDWLATLAPAGTRLLLFLGKGGVGKSTCAATTALALAARGTAAGRILLLSTDPAHSLGDVLGHDVGDRARRVPGAPSSLWAREIDADRGFRLWRERHGDAVDALFGGGDARSGVDLPFDREVARDLLELTPPGLDELWSVRTLLTALFPPHGSGPRYRLAVVDTAPTGHALRMLAMPDTALAWVRAALEILLRYRRIARPGALARDLVEISRDLRRFRALLRDARATRAVVVSRPGRLPGRETERLLARLRAGRIGVSALVLNAMPTAEAGRCAHCAARARIAGRDLAALPAGSRRRGAILVAPAVSPPPRGVAALEDWGRRWTRMAG
jgi:arsenite/tail-anchored protein-transporting ATPase